MKIEIMGKKILTAMIVAVVAVVAGYNIYVSQKDITLSELALANIEHWLNIMKWIKMVTFVILLIHQQIGFILIKHLLIVTIVIKRKGEICKIDLIVENRN